jgi:hypothetical protein
MPTYCKYTLLSKWSKKSANFIIFDKILIKPDKTIHFLVIKSGNRRDRSPLDHLPKCSKNIGRVMGPWRGFRMVLDAKNR